MRAPRLSPTLAVLSALPALTAAWAFPLLYFVAICARRASTMMLGRDQTTFQYVAWAIRRGAVDYRQIRDFNGPLIHALHWAFALLGGLEPGRFRLLDLTGSAIAFAFIGACLPGITRANSASPPVFKWTRATWGLAGVALLAAQYFFYLFWDLAQRESFCDWFLFAAIGCELIALGSGGPRWSEGPRARALLALSGAAFTMGPFCKPTYGVFGLVGLGVLVICAPRDRRRGDLLAFALGGLAGATLLFAFVGMTGNIVWFVHDYFVEGPQLYVTLWHVPAQVIFARAGFPNYHLAGFAISAGLFALILLKALPRRAILIASMAPLSSLMVLIQGKGFPYHYHPLTASIVLGVMTLALAVSEGCDGLLRPALRFTGSIPLVALVVPIALEMPKGSPYLRPDHTKFEGLAWDAPHPDADGFFGSLQFAPRDIAQAAAVIRATTPEDQAIFVYGCDPYIFTLANRSSATPFLVPLQINTDLLVASDPEATPATRARREALRLANVREMTDDLTEHLPSVFVFVDFAPFLSNADAWADFAKHAPDAAMLVRANYQETQRFGTVRLWTRKRIP